MTKKKLTVEQVYALLRRGIINNSEVKFYLQTTEELAALLVLLEEDE